MRRGFWLLWLLVVALSALQVTRTGVVTDATSFLPGPANAEQRLMAGQLRDGISTRILIVGLRLPAAGASPPKAAEREALAAASRALRDQLAANSAFAWVSNGDVSRHEAERERLFSARYLLSPGVTPQAFSADGLAEAMRRLEGELVSFRGGAIKSLAAADPTLESLQLLEHSSAQFKARGDADVWFSADGRAVLLMLETTARGHDIDGVRDAIGVIRGSAQSVLKDWPATVAIPAIEFAGAGHFNVLSHDAIGRDAGMLSLIATVLVCSLLLWALRSPRFLLLAIIPVGTGTLAGFAAAGLVNGSIHGITLAFGITLLGEAVDYAIYSFVQRDGDGRHASTFWATLWLAVATSLIGFAAMFFSGFQGLQQLGLFSIVGLVVAGACTRWLLPELLPAPRRDASRRVEAGLARVTRVLRGFRWPLLLLAVAMAALIAARGESMWRDNLDALSASSAQDTARDLQWRDDIGAAELRSMLAVRGADVDQALLRAEAAAGTLDRLVREGEMRGYDSPAVLLPSRAVQHARQAALPEPEALRARLGEALKDGRLRAAAFEPFLADVATARNRPPVERSHYAGTLIGSWLAGQVIESEDGATVLILLRGPVPGHRIGAKLREANLPGVSLLDLQGDVEALVADYRRQTLRTALLGAVGIFLVIALQLRDRRALGAMLATLVATVSITAGVLLLIAGSLTVFNLVALLLVAGVASNYALFFATLSPDAGERQRTSLSVLLAGASTFIVFAVLVASSTPVLAMIGATVAIGAAVGLICSMAFSPR
ncbi:MAG: MMPL family transporter [Sterolibacteriaceae bacterium]|nr:MMPL family transporter [Sterolibacteriaceae bacterium]